MNNYNIIITRELDLCISCEICSIICPVDAITMKYSSGKFLPEVDKDKCKMCGQCFDLCPGIDIYPLELRVKKSYKDIIHENYLESYTAYSKDSKIRRNSSSGGLITNLVIELIKDKIFDFVFVLDFDNFDGKPARLESTDNFNKIFKSAKSKYIPASVYEIIKTLKEKGQKKHIIIGTPCQILGIKKFIKKYKIPENTLLFLGLFCASTLNFNILRYFEDNYSKSKEKMSKFQFRTKEKYGWPGHSKIYFDSGRCVIIDRNIRMSLKKYFTLNRCLFCLDKLNKLSDISFGDCYIKEKMDLNGKSSVIIRTEKGKEIFDKYSYLFALEKENIINIWKSQGIVKTRDNLYNINMLIKKMKIYPEVYFEYKNNPNSKKKFLKLQKYINWGKKYEIKTINFNLILLKQIKRVKSILNYFKKSRV